MGSRLLPRVAITTRAVLRRLAGGRRVPPADPRRILVAHHLLLGDTLMLTALLARLRARYPAAEITMTVPRVCAPLYAHRPYGVRALPWNPRDFDAVRALLAEPAFDLALIPGDNRHAWLAQAMGARWIVAFAGDRPAYKSWAVDELLAIPETPSTWYDLMATMAGGGPPPPYRPSDWTPPAAAPFERPPSPYAVLHVGASSPLKLWPPAYWRALAAHLRARGLRVAWSAGPGEEALVAPCGPDPADHVVAGRLDLAQLWQLVGAASLVVCPDTSVAHLGRIAGTPTVALFGPGSALLAGSGRFWRESRYRALSVVPFPCRDQHLMFKREVPWVSICKRSTAECAAPRCMEALTVAAVAAACDEFLEPEDARV